MKRILPIVLILLAMLLVGAMYWVDLSYNTDLTSGFTTRGEVWMRYALLAVPLLMAVLGIQTVGPRAIAVLRMRNRSVGIAFAVAALAGIAHGIVQLLSSFAPFSPFLFIQSLLFLWYGVWMVLCTVQFFRQDTVSPTTHSLFGILAALPFCGITIHRVLISPSSLYRLSSVVSALSAMFIMLWFGLLLRALYIAMPQSRVRWMYLSGAICFLLSTCLELPQSLHAFLFSGGSLLTLLESANLAMLGIGAAALSVAISDQATEVTRLQLAQSQPDLY